MDPTPDLAGAPRGNAAYFVTIEGKEFPWPKGEITTEEIAHAGGWPVSEGVKEIDIDNVEHDLRPGQTIQLTPGHGFAKKVRWKRG